MKLQKNFSFDEFVSPKDTIKPDVGQILNVYKVSKELQILREVLGWININSGFRSKARNKEVGGSANSHHLSGLAVDITFDFSNWNDDILVRLFTGLGWTNIGIYKRGSEYVWIHLDLADTRWNEVNGWQHIKDSSVKFYKV